MSTVIVETRSQDLSTVLDAHAVAQVDQMVVQGWDPTIAAAAWLDWVGRVAVAAADMAVAESSWRAGPA